METKRISQPVLYLVIPCYNEEAVLSKTAGMFFGKLQSLISSGTISDSSRILYVNDGSSDSTWSIINGLSASDPHYCGISLSRNRGHQNALLAGLMEAKELCDISISIDCDGQDDINAVDRMIEAWKGGAEVVYGVREDRSSDSWFKRSSAQAFYKLMNRLGAESVYNHADYRLVSARVLKELAGYQEVNLFLRGMFPLIGFSSTAVSYSRKERIAGRTHYPLKKMLALAADGITGLSIKPIRIITLMGILVSFLSFIGILYALSAVIRGSAVSGWASTICIVCFLGGIQLLSLGIIGEYVGKTYLETKHRPRFIIAERIGMPDAIASDTGTPDTISNGTGTLGATANNTGMSRGVSNDKEWS